MKIKFKKIFHFKNIKILILCLLFIYPIVIVPVAHAASAIFLLLFLLGCFYGWPVWKKLNNKEKLFLYSFLAFTIIGFLSIINAEDVKHFGERMEKLIRFAFAIPVYLILKRVGSSTLTALKYGLMFGGIVLMCVMFYQFGFNYAGRITLGEHYVVRFGVYSMTLSIASITAAIFSNALIWQRIFMWISAGGALLAAFYSGTRGAWIAFPVIIILIAYQLWIFQRGKKIILFYIIVLIALAIGVVASKPEFFNNRIDELVNHETIQMNAKQKKLTHFDQFILKTTENIGYSSKMRIFLSYAGYEIWKENLIIGTGLGDFYLDKHKLFKDTNFYEALPFREGHNIYFEWMAINGTIGFIIMLFAVFLFPFWLFFSKIQRIEKNYMVQHAAAGGMILIVRWAIFGLGMNWFAFSGTTAIYLTLTLVYMSNLFAEDEKENSLSK